MDNNTERFVLDLKLKTESQLQVLLVFAILSNKKLAEALTTGPTAVAIAELGNAPSLNFPDWFLKGKATQIIENLKIGSVKGSPATGPILVSGPISQVADYLATEPELYPDPSAHANIVNSILALLK